MTKKMWKRVYITEYEQLGEDRVGSVVCGGCGWEVTAPPDSLPSPSSGDQIPSPQTSYPWHAAHTRLCPVVLLQILIHEHNAGYTNIFFSTRSL